MIRTAKDKPWRSRHCLKLPLEEHRLRGAVAIIILTVGPSRKPQWLVLQLYPTRVTPMNKTDGAAGTWNKFVRKLYLSSAEKQSKNNVKSKCTGCGMRTEFLKHAEGKMREAEENCTESRNSHSPEMEPTVRKMNDQRKMVLNQTSKHMIMKYCVVMKSILGDANYSHCSS